MEQPSLTTAGGGPSPIPLLPPAERSFPVTRTPQEREQQRERLERRKKRKADKKKRPEDPNDPLGGKVDIRA